MMPPEKPPEIVAFSARPWTSTIPVFIHISDGKMHEVNILDQLMPEPGAFYIVDRGFLDFERLFRFHEAGSFFVTRGKANLKAERRYSHPVDRSTRLICDQTIVWTPSLKEAIEQAKAARPIDFSPWLFCTRKGKGGTSKSLLPSMIFAGKSAAMKSASREPPICSVTRAEKLQSGTMVARQK